MKRFEIILPMCLALALISPAECSDNVQAKRSGKPKAPKYLTLDLGKGVAMKLVRIKAGWFMMGSKFSPAQTARRYGGKEALYTREHPQHEATISDPFYMGIYEVTQAQWRAVMGTEPWKGRNLARPGDNNAANSLSWNDANKFCKILSLTIGGKVSLPTEAQWEYACRAGSKTAYSFGDDASKFGDYAWYYENAYKKDEVYAHAVGRKKPNAWGLYDTYGNVSEWCRDYYDKQFYASSKNVDPVNTTRAQEVVYRGGSFFATARHSRSASRLGYFYDSRDYQSIGFRVAIAPGSGVKNAKQAAAELEKHRIEIREWQAKAARRRKPTAEEVKKQQAEARKRLAKARKRQAEAAKASKIKVNTALDLGKGVTMKLVLIPAGKFLMGSPKTEAGRNDHTEGLQREVTISKPFYMGICEVTQAQWRSVMGTSPWDGRKHAKSGADNAASYITWASASKFCRILSKKTGKSVTLPTEAQWEYACRADTRTAYSFGDDASNLRDYAWCYDNVASIKGEGYVHAVGRKKPNDWGLYDIHGNVWEWCRDYYDKNFYAKAKHVDPENTTKAMDRVARGGSWVERNCRSARRYAMFSNSRIHFVQNYGFRVVVELGSGVD
jgi:formylglycine-generating enzyme required for sulfatase activity